MAESVPQIALLTIGDELLDGRTANTNSLYLGERLAEEGIQLSLISTLGDVEELIVSEMKRLARSFDFVVVSGGLGPTSDDRTREACAALLKKDLDLQQEVLDQIRLRFEKRGYAMPEHNLKQALIPGGSNLINNPVGTASAFSFEYGRSQFYVLPGVPREFNAIIQEIFLPQVRARFSRQADDSLTVRVFGMPESLISEKLVDAGIESLYQVSYRAVFPEIHLKLKSHGDRFSHDDLKKQLTGLLGKENVISFSPDIGPADRVAELLLKRSETLALAESCTGGLIGKLITDLPGSSRFFEGGVICYSNNVKERALGVSSKALESFGAVSEEVAIEMARGARKRLGSTYALSVTGIAGPDGGSKDKPVGLFWVGFSGPSGDLAERNLYPAERTAVRRFAAYSALRYFLTQVF